MEQESQTSEVMCNGLRCFEYNEDCGPEGISIGVCCDQATGAAQGTIDMKKEPQVHGRAESVETLFRVHGVTGF